MSSIEMTTNYTCLQFGKYDVELDQMNVNCGLLLFIREHNTEENVNEMFCGEEFIGNPTAVELAKAIQWAMENNNVDNVRNY